MAGLGIFHSKLFLCLLGLTIALDDSETVLKRSRRESLDSDQTLGPSHSAQTADSAGRTKISNHNNRRSKNSKKVYGKRRCFLGSPYDCPGGFEDTLLDYPRPWGWGPGPLYPEYGPDFHRGWAGHGGPFGCNNFGCGGPWRVPGCSCGCNNHGWCCCGQNGGGGGANDCAQYSDAASSSENPHQGGTPPLLNPFMGKQANSKGPFKMEQGKNINVQRGHRRQDITHGAASDYGWGQAPISQYPYQGSYGSWQVPQQTYPYQGTSYGSWQVPQQTYPYQGTSYGSLQVPPQTYPYQGTYESSQVPQQKTPLDQVVGRLFLWKQKGSIAPAKIQKLKQKN